MNEFILIASLLMLFCGVLIFYRIFGTAGIYCWTALATIAANIEVLIVIEAFGMEQTLGNVMFASMFLATDILSEVAGRKEADKAVSLGIAVTIAFIVISQTWLLYTPAANDWSNASIHMIFSNTPRVMCASLFVYAITQRFDVWAYHKIWELTKKKCGDSKKYLWLRNNAATLLSQLLNTFLFSFGAFYGKYDTKTLLSICASSYIVYIVTSLADTPFVYWARKMHINQS